MSFPDGGSGPKGWWHVTSLSSLIAQWLRSVSVEWDEGPNALFSWTVNWGLYVCVNREWLFSLMWTWMGVPWIVNRVLSVCVNVNCLWIHEHERIPPPAHTHTQMYILHLPRQSCRKNYIFWTPSPPSPPPPPEDPALRFTFLPLTWTWTDPLPHSSGHSEKPGTIRNELWRGLTDGVQNRLCLNRSKKTRLKCKNKAKFSKIFFLIYYILQYLHDW